MAEMLLFHHALGQTGGFHAFAEELRRAGHTVHAPDLFEGRTFGTIDEGMAYAQEVGFPDGIIERGERAANELSAEVVYAGFSLGVVPAQKLAQTRPGARGALLFYSCVPLSYFGTWPQDVPAQIHGMDADPIFVGEGRCRGRPRARRIGRGRRALPLSRRPALLRRLESPELRRRRREAAHATRARVPRRAWLMFRPPRAGQAAVL